MTRFSSPELVRPKSQQLPKKRAGRGQEKNGPGQGQKEEGSQGGLGQLRNGTGQTILSTFRLQGTCNACGGGGHRQAECPSVVRVYALEQMGAGRRQKPGHRPQLKRGLRLGARAPSLSRTGARHSRAGMRGRGSGSTRDTDSQNLKFQRPRGPVPVCPLRNMKGVARDDRGAGLPLRGAAAHTRSEPGILSRLDPTEPVCLLRVGKGAAREEGWPGRVRGERREQRKSVSRGLCRVRYEVRRGGPRFGSHPRGVGLRRCRCVP